MYPPIPSETKRWDDGLVRLECVLKADGLSTSEREGRERKGQRREERKIER